MRPCDSQVGQFAQAVCRATGAREALLLGHFARTVDSVDGGKRDFVLRGVFAGGLAERFGGLLHVQHIVDNLEGEAYMFTELVKAARCRARRPRRSRPCGRWRAAELRFWRDGWIRADCTVGNFPSPSMSFT